MKKEYITGFSSIKKVPFLKWFIVSKSDIERLKQSQSLHVRMWSKNFDEICQLKKKLKRYEG